MSMATCSARMFGVKYGSFYFSIIAFGSSTSSALNIIFIKLIMPLENGTEIIFIILSVTTFLSIVNLVLLDTQNIKYVCK